MKKLISGLAVIIFMFSMSSGKAYAAEALGFEISGFVDSSYIWNDNAVGGTAAEYNTFGLDQVEINITKEIKDWASLRFDLQHCPSAGSCAANTRDDDIIEQGYLTLTAPVGDGVTFTFGKFNAPIGFELLDPVDMYQFSHSLVFNNGIPTNLTGGMLSTSFGEMFDVSFYVVNGWDVNPEGAGSSGTNKTVGGRLGITPIKDVNVGFSGIIGKGDGAGGVLTVFDIDGTIKLIPDLTLGFEFNFGSDNNAIAAGNDADWFGFLLMGHYDFLEWFGMTLRYDYFDDDDGGLRLAPGTPNGRATGLPDTRQAITVSPTFVIGEGFGALFEYRHAFSNQNVFTNSNGTPTDNNDSIAFEMTYAF